MRKIFLLTVCCLLAVTGTAQPSKTDLLVKNVWKIQSEKMSGLGVHTLLPEDIELTFLADGTWKSSRPIKEVSVGKWRLENNERNFVMTIGKEVTSYLILQLTEKDLRYRVRKNAAFYTYSWLSE